MLFCFFKGDFSGHGVMPLTSSTWETDHCRPDYEVRPYLKGGNRRQGEGWGQLECGHLAYRHCVALYKP